MCDRIYTMAAGRLTGEVSRAEATQEVLMRHMTKDTKGTRSAGSANGTRGTRGEGVTR